MRLTCSAICNQSYSVQFSYSSVCVNSRVKFCVVWRLDFWEEESAYFQKVI